MSAPAWTRDLVVAALRRDAHLSAHFAEIHGIRAPRGRAAEEYCRWCIGEGLDELAGAPSVEAFVPHWRLRAAAADVRIITTGAQARLLAALVCATFALIAVVRDPLAATGYIAAAMSVVLAASVFYSRSMLIVGPDAPKRFALDEATDQARILRGLAFRLTNFRKI